VKEVSDVMGSTNPVLSAFKALGGKLIILEHMADYAQSPYAGIGHFESVQKKMGEAQVAEFARLYAAPGVDHVGSGAPANVDMLKVLVDWVEQGKAPGRSRGDGAEGGDAGHGRALAAAVPVANVAEVQAGGCEEGGEFCVRKVRGSRDARLAPKARLTEDTS
jgi:hypothetical protein